MANDNAQDEQQGNEKSRGEQIEKLGELIKDIRIAMLTTAEPDGTLRSRPMANQDQDKAKFDGTLWFFTSDDSGKVEEIQQDRHVNISFADPGKESYISISGTATLVRDRAKMEELYTPFLKAWWPDGLEDPNIALLRIDVTQAEYWDSNDSRVVQLLGLAKALVTGQPMKGGENEKIDL